MPKHTWNYRIAINKDPKNDLYYGAIYEVHYTDDRETAMAETPATFGTDLNETEEETREEIVKALELALKNAKEKPLFYPPKIWDVPGYN